MYITKITLKDIRCFEDVKVDLSSSEGAKKWLVIIGNNGVGKTSMLRSIAMGLCDLTGAASLLQDSYGEWIRKGAKKGSIEIELIHNSKQYSIETEVRKSVADLEEIYRDPDHEKKFPWEEIFICGYGANRSIEGDSSHEIYSSADAVYTLFGYDYALQNPELMLLRRVRKSEKSEKEICDWLADILILPKGSIKLTDFGITITDYGHEIVWGSLADGYEATMTLVLDMLGWAMLAGIKKYKNNLSGIVIIDELEQHLHPELQRRIIRNLNKAFPKVQFIATSHSPICAAGLADLPDEKCSLELLKRLDNGFVDSENLSTMRGWRYDQILTSRAFGIPARNVKTQDLLDKLKTLYMKDRLSKAEDAKLKELLEELKEESLLGAEAAKLEITEEKINKIRKQLKQDNND